MVETAPFPENSSKVASEAASWFGIQLLLALCSFGFCLAIPIQHVVNGFDPDQIWGGGAVHPLAYPGIIFMGFLTAFFLISIQAIPFYNQMKPIKETVQAALIDFHNSRQRKINLVESVNSLAQRLSNEEYSIHQGIAQTAKEAATEISRGKSASVVLANLASQFPSLTSYASFQSAQENAARIEDQIDQDLRRVNRLLSAYNEIVTAFPTFVFAKPLGFPRMDYISDEPIRS